MLELSPDLLEQVDPYGGFIQYITFWRPDPAAPDPDMPGLKMQSTFFKAVKPGEPCLCGSGRRYGQCCRPKRAWQIICANPGMKGYSGVVPQKVAIEVLDAPTLKQRLKDDPRLAITEDIPGGGFWIYWGDPYLEDPAYGVICFGDLELKPDGSLQVTAMSDVRMQALLGLLAEIAADCLGPAPPVQKDPPLTIKKPPRRRRK
jgi:hypothetical protein